MHESELYQIYHVARCGSTLLTSLLSNCQQTFSEPPWTHGLFNNTKCPDEITDYYDSIVKFQSIATIIAFKPPGPKVFLYRPLDQYLVKMTTCSDEWIAGRKQLYGTWWKEIKGTELSHLEPETILQLHAIFWAACVLKMKKTEDVLWIKSNDFFLNKEDTAKQVLDHFGKKESPNMEFSNIDVKALRLNGSEIKPLSDYKISPPVPDNHGIIESHSVEQIFNTVEWANANIPGIKG
jgi:hypothetical protein